MEAKAKAKDEVGLAITLLVVAAALTAANNWLPRPLPEWIARVFF